jgi:hypothetical protein
MLGMAKALWLPGWLPAKALRFLPVREPLEERRVAARRLSIRMVEGILVAIVALLIRSAPHGTTQDLAKILFSISLVALSVLGIVEFRAWRRWGQ